MHFIPFELFAIASEALKGSWNANIERLLTSAEQTNGGVPQTAAAAATATPQNA